RVGRQPHRNADLDVAELVRDLTQLRRETAGFVTARQLPLDPVDDTAEEIRAAEQLGCRNRSGEDDAYDREHDSRDASRVYDGSREGNARERGECDGARGELGPPGFTVPGSEVLVPLERVSLGD